MFLFIWLYTDSLGKQFLSQYNTLNPKNSKSALSHAIGEVLSYKKKKKRIERGVLVKWSGVFDKETEMGIERSKR